MARPRKTPVAAADDNAPPVAETQPIEREQLELKPAEPAAKKRLSFAVTPEGQIEWDSMRSETKADIIAAIKASPVPGISEGERPVFSDETLGLVWKGLGRFEAVVVTRPPFAIPPKIAKQVFVYSSEEEKALAAALQAVLKKYEWLNQIKYKEEVDLIGMMVSLFMLKLQVAAELKKQSVTIEVPPRVASSGQTTPMDATDAGVPQTF